MSMTFKQLDLMFYQDCPNLGLKTQVPKGGFGSDAMEEPF